ncbi:unnamed protein product, partial [Laminaria digitata]
MEFPVDGSQEPGRQKHLPSVYFAEGSVGALLEWYGPQTTGAKSDLSRRLNSFKIATASNPQADMGRIEDLAAEMRTAGMILDDNMLYTIFLDALPSEYDI